MVCMMMHVYTLCVEIMTHTACKDELVIIVNLCMCEYDNSKNRVVVTIPVGWTDAIQY